MQLLVSFKNLKDAMPLVTAICELLVLNLHNYGYIVPNNSLIKEQISKLLHIRMYACIIYTLLIVL